MFYDAILDADLQDWLNQMITLYEEEALKEQMEAQAQDA